MARGYRSAVVVLVTSALLSWSGDDGRAADANEMETLKRQVEELRRSDAEKTRQLEELKALVQQLVTQQKAAAPAPAAPKPAGGTAPGAPAVAESTLDRAVREAQESAPPPAAGTPAGPAALDEEIRDLARQQAPIVTGSPSERAARGLGLTEQPALFARRIGGANVRLIDVSMDILTAAGGSTADDSEIRQLEFGAHDPQRRGFTLQQAELSFSGAVDPYFTGEAHVVFTPDDVELEEAFMTTTRLPYGFQVEAGYFLTEFGRINPLHPHAWAWIDQPVIVGRLLGPDGLRSPGARVGWLAPTPWFTEVHLGVQNANEGDRTLSFLDGESAVGGRPAVTTATANMSDLLYLARVNGSHDFSDSVTGLFGVSGLFGPNSTGNGARTYVYGLDMTWKWQPADSLRGWPFVTWQTEVMGRNYDAKAYVAGTATDDPGGGHSHGDDDDHEHEDDDADEDIPGALLRDWGLYTQLLWGFHWQWAAGLRYEYATGSGASLPDGRQADFLRDDRHRVSPLLIWQPSEFSRFRLQYNYDHADFLPGNHAHTIWFGMEILYGAHPAHSY